MESEILILRQILLRPMMYTGVRSASAVLAFLSGYELGAIHHGGSCCWGDLFEKLRFIIDPDLRPGNAHTLQQVLMRMCGGDEEKAFELLSREMLKLLPPESPPATAQS